MAKKSAKSKGYRKTVSKKPYLSKRDIGILCVLFVIIAVAAILLFSYDDGALKLADGKLTGIDVAGKTGSAGEVYDRWFIGYTPRLVSGGWVGGEDRDIHFDNASLGQGANAALPIWAYFMKKVYRDTSLPYKPTSTFGIPESFNPCAKDDDGGLGIEEVYE